MMTHRSLLVMEVLTSRDWLTGLVMHFCSSACHRPVGLTSRVTTNRDSVAFAGGRPHDLSAPPLARASRWLRRPAGRPRKMRDAAGAVAGQGSAPPAAQPSMQVPTQAVAKLWPNT